jgi:signal transduction histidine kinase
MFKSWILLVITCTLFYRVFAAQDSLSFHLRHYTDESGLPQNSVKSVAQDKEGFIWLTTEDGLVRFDGTRFVRFGQKEMNISSSRFRNFYRKEGDGLFCVNDRNEYIQIRNGLPYRDTVEADFLKSQLHWHIPGRPAETGVLGLIGLPDPVQNTGVTPGKMIFDAGNGNSYRIDMDSISFYQGAKPAYTVPFSPGNRWDFFLLDSQLFYLRKNGSAVLFSNVQMSNISLEGDIINDQQYKNGRRDITVFWNISVREHVLFYFNRSFYLVKPGTHKKLSTRRIFTGFEVAGKNIFTAYYNESDRQLYLGSSTRGLFVLSAQQFRALTASTGENVYYGQAACNDSTIITAQGKMFGLLEKPRSIPAVTKLIPSDFYSMFTGSEGNTWIKSSRKLYELSKDNFSVLNNWSLPNPITMIYEGMGNRVWIGVKETGLAVLDKKNKAGQPYLFISLDKDITYLQQTTDDILYLATGTGLYRLHLSSKRIDTIKGLENMYVRSIYAARTDEVWISTYENGFFLYYKDSLTAFPPDRDNYLSATHCIIEDNRGFLWLTTNKGLFQVAKDDLLAYTKNKEQPLYYHYYDKSNGFNTNEFNGGCQPCAVKLGNGYVSLPSLNGLVFFNPDSIRPALPGNALFLDKIEMDNQELDNQELAHLPGQFGQIKFYISSPCTGNKKNLHISYTLAGKNLSPVWLPLPEDGAISFSALPAGSYTLMVRKLNGFGKGNYTQKNMELVIAPAWYETTWFYAGCILLLVICMWLFIRFRFKYIKNRNRVLEQTVATKTKELQRQTEIQDKIIRSVSHDIQTPLQYQKLLAQKLYNGVLSDGNPSTVGPAKVLNDSAHRLFHMVENLLKYLKVQMAEGPGCIEAVGLFALVEEKLMIFNGIAAEKGTTICNNIPMELIFPGDKQLFSVMLHNIIDNAVKVTRNGIININAGLADGRVCIMVEDTGPGMHASLQKWINTATGISNEGKEIAVPHGIGLMMVKELAVLTGTGLRVNSIPGKGTCFSVIL